MHKISEKYNKYVFYKKTVLKNFSIFTGKRLCWSLFFNKIAGYQSCNYIKKRLQHKCFSVNIANFLRTSFLTNICERMLERFPTWTYFWRRYFNKYKTKENHSKNQLDEKELAFSWCSWSFHFSLFFHCISHNKRW